MLREMLYDASVALGRDRQRVLYCFRTGERVHSIPLRQLHYRPTSSQPRCFHCSDSPEPSVTHFLSENLRNHAHSCIVKKSMEHPNSQKLSILLHLSHVAPVYSPLGHVSVKSGLDLLTYLPSFFNLSVEWPSHRGSTY